MAFTPAINPMLMEFQIILNTSSKTDTLADA